MAVWELVRDTMLEANMAGQEWLNIGQITHGILAKEPTTNRGTIHGTVRYHCINDPSKKHSPGLQYKTNPLFVTDSPTMRGKRYRLLTEGERSAFLAQPRDDLESVTYMRVAEWLQDTSVPIGGDAEEEPIDESSEPDAVPGLALLELHLQDYIHRHWASLFPELSLYRGDEGREFRTSDPGVGIVDFLCTDKNGNFLVIETKRDIPDRRAVGQILGYMGWVNEKLCHAGQTVKGMLIAGQISEELRLAVRPVPGLELRKYELSFTIERVEQSR